MAEWNDTLETLVKDRERALLGYAYLVCGNATQAQDLVQEALVKTFSRPRDGLTALKAESYVRRAITSVYVDQYRRQRRWNRLQHVFATPAAAATDSMVGVEMSRDVAAALTTLPPRERACIMLRFFDDLTVPQIGRVLGLADGSVKRYLSDAIEKLELVLGPLEDTHEETIPVLPQSSYIHPDERKSS